MMWRRLAVLSLGLFLLGVDQLSKWLTVSYVTPVEQSVFAYPYGGIGIFRNVLGIEFSINHVTNTGAIWGVLSGHALILSLLRLAAVAGLFIYLLCGRYRRSAQVPLVLVLVGAVGNILDAYLYGHVVDMFHFCLWGWHYPWFNFADAFIFVGVVWLFALSFRGARAARKRSAPSDPLR